MAVIVTTSPGFGKHGRPRELIARSGWEFIRCADPSRPGAEFSAHIARADILAAGLPPVTTETTETLAGAGRLKAVLNRGVGVDNIDIDACSAPGPPVCNTPGANADAASQLALDLMIGLARPIPQERPHRSVCR